MFIGSTWIYRSFLMCQIHLCQLPLGGVGIQPNHRLDRLWGDEKAEAADGHVSLLMNVANGYDLEGNILGPPDAEPSLGRNSDALAYFEKALDIAEDLARKDEDDYLGRHNVATASLEIGNILRHRNAKDSLAVYDHALARVREAKSNAVTQRDEADLLTASSYALRWAGREKEAREHIVRSSELLQQAGQYGAGKV